MDASLDASAFGRPAPSGCNQLPPSTRTPMFTPPWANEIQPGNHREIPRGAVTTQTPGRQPSFGSHCPTAARPPGVWGRRLRRPGDRERDVPAQATAPRLRWARPLRLRPGAVGCPRSTTTSTGCAAAALLGPCWGGGFQSRQPFRSATSFNQAVDISAPAEDKRPGNS